MRGTKLARLAGALLAAALIGGSVSTTTLEAREAGGSIQVEQNGVSHMPGAPTPGPQMLQTTLTPVIARTASKSVSRGSWAGFFHFDCYMAPPPSAPGATLVGYDDDVESCPIDDWVYQTVLKFDLTPLRRYHQVIITRALLKYGESVIAQRLGNGKKPGGAGFTSCGSAIGVPDNGDWQSPGFRGLIGNRDAPIDEGSSSPGEWNITTLVEHWWTYDDNVGLVIRGDNESFPENDAACVAYLNGFKLELIFQRGP